MVVKNDKPKGVNFYCCIRCLGVSRHGEYDWITIPQK